MFPNPRHVRSAGDSLTANPRTFARKAGPRCLVASTCALTTLKVRPTEVVTDVAPIYLRVVDELVPAAWHHVERYANNRIEAAHSRLKHRLRPMRGLRTDRTAQVVVSGLAFMQNLRRGHYELATETLRPLRVAAAFAELASAI